MTGTMLIKWNRHPTWYRLLSVFALTTLSIQASSACFDGMLKSSCQWIQPISQDIHYTVDVCSQDDGVGRGSRMSMKSVNPSSVHTKDIYMDCLQSFKNDSYLVKVHNLKETFGYQCLRLSALTSKVIRIAKSPMQEHKANCLSETYITDDHVLVSSTESSNSPCPLSGSFYLKMPESERSTCARSIARYEPYLHFQCDRRGSGQVFADLGAYCSWHQLPPGISSHALQLTCLDSWQEQAGFTSLIMKIKEGSYFNFWCLHLIDKSTGDQSLYSIMLAADGRCLERFPLKRASPGNRDLLGSLVAFTPGSSPGCSDPASKCDDVEATYCQNHTQCLRMCGRCELDVRQSSCVLPVKLRGKWFDFTSKKNKQGLVVHESAIYSANNGKFRCVTPPPGLHDRYTMVREDAEASCMPFYACAMIKNPVPGLLLFHLELAPRNIDNGNVLPCQFPGSSLERGPDGLTLHTENLDPVPCGLEGNMSFPTDGSECEILVHACSGSCQEFTISLNQNTCGNATLGDTGIASRHTCVAAIALRDNLRLLLTRIAGTNRYFCWIPLGSRLFVLPPQDCSMEGFDRAMNDRKADIKYDPLRMLYGSDKADATSDMSRVAATRASQLQLVLCSVGVILLRALNQ